MESNRDEGTIPGTRVAIGLGSNLGDRSGHLAVARDRLSHEARFELERVSSLYVSAPIGPEQPDYLNQVIIGRTPLSPRELLTACGRIEAELGRERGEVRWGPRTIDLDILVFGEERIALHDLVIPHPECTRRRFVLVPWAEIDPHGIVPGVVGAGGVPRRLEEILADLERAGDTAMVERWESARS